MNAVIESIAAGDKPDLVHTAIPQGLVFSPGLLSDEGWRDMPDGNVCLCRVHHHTLSFQFVTDCLLQVHALPVKLGRPYFEGGSLVLLPEREGSLVGGGRVCEAVAHVLIERLVILGVDLVEVLELLGVEDVCVDLDLG